VPRSTAFVGTTNAERYLPDDTGARRFNPVYCTKVDKVALAADRLQLWAEARRRFDVGETWHLEGARARDAQETQEERRIADPWEEDVAKWISGRAARSAITTLDVMNGLEIDIRSRDRHASMRIGNALRILGWRRERESDGDRRWLYHPPSERSGGIPTNGLSTVSGVTEAESHTEDEDPWGGILD
jgi:putative DNA primase/helicase